MPVKKYIKGAIRIRRRPWRNGIASEIGDQSLLVESLRFQDLVFKTWFSRLGFQDLVFKTWFSNPAGVKPAISRRALCYRSFSSGSQPQ